MLSLFILHLFRCHFRMDRTAAIIKYNVFFWHLFCNKAAPIPDAAIEFDEVTLDRSEVDNSKWLSYITTALKDAKSFEIHCWNEESEWIELALQHGKPKDDDWRHGKIIAGDVTPEFVQMLLGLPKPTDTEIYNKMTPFFNVFLDNVFQSCHYGTENYYK